jgi:hypothetical protein
MDEPIQLPAMKRLWRVRFADSLDNPKISSTVLVRGSQTCFDAMTQCKKYEGWQNFRKAYPEAEIVAVEYGGRIEN